MVDPIDLPDMNERFARMRAQLGGSGSGPTGGDVDRVGALEKSVEKIQDKLDKIMDHQHEFRLTVEQRFGAFAERLASIDAKLDTKASAVELAEIKGRVNSLPTTWQMITLVVGTVFTILGGSFLILKFGLSHIP